VIAALNASGIPYCVLGENNNGLAFTGSDMDFVVRPMDVYKIPGLLAAAAARAGARVVQAIRHESSACYFVLARQRGSTVTFFHPDCTTDYRRDTRLWLYAGELLDGRQAGEDGVLRPAPPVNFRYYLMKQVLKGTLSDEQWHRLRELQAARPCGSNLQQLGSKEIADGLERALAHDDGEWLRQNRPCLLGQLKASPYREPLLARLRAWLDEAARLARRILQPTGLLVRIEGGSAAERSELATRLANAMVPAFRRRRVMDGSPPGYASRPPLAPTWLQTLTALIASTLVVTTNRASWMPRLFRSLDITLTPGSLPEHNLRDAIGMMLAYLERRTARRVGLIVPRRMQLTAAEREAC
jgi:hypothetical protein